MNIDKFTDVIKACRFCFMCRHLSPVGNVSFRESDTPRGRALICGKLKENTQIQPDFADVFYRSELSAANRFHCVSHYDEAGLIMAARRDIVEAGAAPENVKKLVEELKKVSFKVSGTGDVLYYIDEYTEAQSSISSALAKIYGKKFKTISGGDIGKALKVLGFEKDAEAVFKKFAKSVKESGCKTIVTSCPASYDAMKNDFKLEGIKVLHSSEFIAGLKLKGTKAVNAYYLDSDYLKNYNENFAAPRELLGKLSYKLKMFGTNVEESYSCGEGAVVFDKLNPELAARLAAHVLEFADNPGKDIVITSSPYTRFVLNKYAPSLKVISLEEAVLKAMEK